MTDLVVHHVDLSILGDQAFFMATVEHERIGDAVYVRGSMIPVDCFESRAAEYNIDPQSPTGWHDLLQLVIVGDRAKGPIEDQLNHPDHLFNAPTVDHARRAILGRIRTHLGGRKLRGEPGVSNRRMIANQATAIGDSGAEDPLEFIKRMAPMSAEHIAVKAEFTRRRRAHIRALRERRNPMRLQDFDAADDQAQQSMRRDMRLMPPRESVDELAARLLGQPAPDLDHRRAAAAGQHRDPNDEIRNRLPPREGPPSSQL